MRFKMLLLLSLLILAIGCIGVLYAEDVPPPADPNAIVDSNDINDPNIVVPE